MKNDELTKYTVKRKYLGNLAFIEVLKNIIKSQIENKERDIDEVSVEN